MMPPMYEKAHSGALNPIIATDARSVTFRVTMAFAKSLAVSKY